MSPRRPILDYTKNPLMVTPITSWPMEMAASCIQENLRPDGAHQWHNYMKTPKWENKPFASKKLGYRKSLSLQKLELGLQKASVTQRHFFEEVEASVCALGCNGVMCLLLTIFVGCRHTQVRDLVFPLGQELSSRVLSCPSLKSEWVCTLQWDKIWGGSSSTLIIHQVSDLTSWHDCCGCKPTKEDVKCCFMLEFDHVVSILFFAMFDITVCKASK